MDLTQLRTFIAIAETGSFSAAAERLHSVQSNITQRIRRLEQHLGGQLFERGRGGARLTALGERLLPHARDILARIAAAETELLDAAGAAAPLRLGALETTAGTRLPSVLQALSLAVPRAEVSLSTAASGPLMQRVWQRRLDAAFVVGPVDAGRFHAVPAFEETLVVARAAAMNGADTLLAFGDGCSYRAAARHWLRGTGHADTPVREMGSLNTILACVGAGLGFAVAPLSAIENYGALDTLVVEPLGAGFEHSETLLIWRIDGYRTRTLNALIEILRTGTA